MTIRSYRRVFNVDRRLYRVDKWAIPVPGGIPLWGIAYFAMAELAMVLLGFLPFVGMLSPPLRYIIAPLAFAVFANRPSPDGRTYYAFVVTWTKVWAVNRLPRRGKTVGGRLPTKWDLNAPDLHRLRVQGPARVVFAVPVRFSLGWHGRFRARRTEGGQVGPYDVKDAESLEVRS
jgi:hypothetical protein